MTSDLPQIPDQSWKTRTYLVSGMVGLAVGLLAGYFYVRVSDENDSDGAPQIKTMDALALAVALLGIVRQITDLGAKNSKKK